MIAEQLKELAGGANPVFMDLDLDHGEIIKHLARRVLAAEKLEGALDLFERGEVTFSAVQAALTSYREASK